MKFALVISMTLMISSISHSPNPFDRYIAQVKSGQTSATLKSAAQDCGVAMREHHPRYAVSVGSWRVSTNLPKDVYDSDSDFLSTAELWTGSNGAKLLNLWSIDLLQDVDTQFCFDPDGHLRFARSVNWSFSDERDQKIRWIYKQQRTFNEDGSLKSKVGHFENDRGQVIPRPALDGDDAKSFDWMPQGSSLKELGLPEEWRH